MLYIEEVYKKYINKKPFRCSQVRNDKVNSPLSTINEQLIMWNDRDKPILKQLIFKGQPQKILAFSTNILKFKLRFQYLFYKHLEFFRSYSFAVPVSTLSKNIVFS